jgi:hypothetical protein
MRIYMQNTKTLYKLMAILLPKQVQWNLYSSFMHALFSCKYHTLSLVSVHCPFK